VPPPRTPPDSRPAQATANDQSPASARIRPRHDGQPLARSPPHVAPRWIRPPLADHPMTGTSPRTPAIDVQPIVSYPRTAARGKRYLLTIDLRSSTTPDAWPSDSEELAVYCAARAEPPGMFRIQPLGRPSVVVHRFGGSYGPASFVLTAA